jgi:hypothetical protein
MVNILAKFPSQGLNTMVSADQVKECFGRHLHQHAYDWAPRILGGDVARFGDDQTILFPRQGLHAAAPIILRSQDTVQVAGRWAQEIQQWGADSIQIDATGGYGAGVIDVLKSLGFESVPVEFAGKPRDPKFFNKRAEIYWEACEWIKSGASLPDLPDLVYELSSATYAFKGDKLIVEPKELMKARLGRSPDLADALACTFSAPVQVRRSAREALFQFDIDQRVSKARSEYDPFNRD